MSCNSKDAPDTSVAISEVYEEAQVLGEIENNEIDEASGLAASINFKGAIWTHNDSGGKNSLYLMDKMGKHLGEFVLNGIENRDWEDIAVGGGPEKGKNYIYLGEIGDNRAQYPEKYIYRILEPSSVSSPSTSDTIYAIEKITFTYPDGNRDAETLMINPHSLDLYVISKREDSVHFYKAPFPQNTAESFPLEKMGTLPFYNINGGDISPDGSEILIKNYYNIYYWYVENNDIPNTLLNNKPLRLRYEPEPQGEAICFSREPEGGFYTVSEEKIYEAVVNFYPRVKK